MTERDRYENDERAMMEQNGEDAKVAMICIACLPFVYLSLVGLSSLLFATP